ncbi:class I adenylate-forming enzyme family protein [Actinocorallia longicatena]|uniref:Long-chain fatty acid--CoA ligase n=1 Tax=Actinocorallia longicatena TaxID=111803 RepID=A0ABP6Q3Z9_9ACTN
MWLAGILERNLRRGPDRTALRDVRRNVTWREFDRDVGALAETIGRRASAGDRVLVLSGNRVEVLETYFACAAAGAVATPLNPALTDTEIDGILGPVAPVLAIADAPGLERLARLRPGLPLLPIEDVAELPDASGPPPAPVAMDAPAAILHTSATSGRPKGVVVDQRSFALNAFSWMADVGAGEGTVFLNACPLFHGSMVIALDYLAAGATVCVLDRFTPQGCLTALETWRAGHAFLVPSMVALLLETRALAGTRLDALDLLLHGAAPMPPSLADAAAARLGVRLQTIYGITEGGGPALSLRPDDKPAAPPVPGATCAGRPMLGTVARIAGPDDRTLGPGEIGELRLRGDGVMRGYWNEPEATAEALRGGELNTRDLCGIDGDGFFWVVDRRTDLILRGGQNVYPAEIEHVLREASCVADVAVVPAPSNRWGQTPVAFLSAAGPAGIDEAELLRLCVAHLAPYKRPSRFVTVEEIPRNPAGKILRTRLRERAAEA